VLSSHTSFWVAWFLPMLLLVPFYLLAVSVWRNAAPRTMTTENARNPFVASVSVLAIAIPLIANLTFEVSRQQSILGSLVFFSMR
jgi:hypothetical protein